MSYEFKPFDRVLVRDVYPHNTWHVDFFEWYIEGNPYPFNCIKERWQECVPYEGNEHLLGTTKDPEEKKKPFEWGEKLIHHCGGKEAECIYLRKDNDCEMVFVAFKDGYCGWVEEIDLSRSSDE